VGGVRVKLAEETDYPFRETVRITVSPEKAIPFPLLLRIPVWAAGAAVMVNGKGARAAVVAGSYTRLEQVWEPGDVVEVRLPMKPRAVRGFNESVSLERGPLVFALDLKGSWVKLRDRGMTADWQVFPSVPWNYALASAREAAVVESEVGGRPFAAAGAPVKLQVRGRRVHEWRSEDGVALAIPVSPVKSAEADEPLTLIPYAAAKLRITSFPALAEEKS
jgi:hypothetical protein